MKNRALASAGLGLVSAGPLSGCEVLGTSPSEVSDPYLQSGSNEIAGPAGLVWRKWGD